MINNGTIADGILNDFYNEVQGTSAFVPMMYVVGNHELQLGDGQAGTHCLANGSECRGLAFTKRVSRTMPTTGGSGSPFWYSFNYGPVHFLAFSTEHAYARGSPQWQWVLSDLQSVDRAATPWVVAYAHRPMICSNTCACRRRAFGCSSRDRWMGSRRALIPISLHPLLTPHDRHLQTGVLTAPSSATRTRRCSTHPRRSWTPTSRATPTASVRAPAGLGAVEEGASGILDCIY